VDWPEVQEILMEAHRMVAPKKLVAEFGLPSIPAAWPTPTRGGRPVSAGSRELCYGI